MSGRYHSDRPDVFDAAAHFARHFAFAIIEAQAEKFGRRTISHRSICKA